MLRTIGKWVPFLREQDVEMSDILRFPTLELAHKTPLIRLETWAKIYNTADCRKWVPFLREPDVEDVIHFAFPIT